VVKLGEDNQILVKVISSRVFDKRGHYGRREYLAGSIKRLLYSVIINENCGFYIPEIGDFEKNKLI
jgi:hypothetical protein